MGRYETESEMLCEHGTAHIVLDALWEIAVRHPSWSTHWDDFWCQFDECLRLTARIEQRRRYRRKD